MTLDQAKIKVLQTVNGDEEGKYIVDEYSILETALAWYIPFIAINPNVGEIHIGAYDGFIVDKTTEEMHRPGSGCSIEQWLASHKLGLLNGPHDLIITKVNDDAHTRKLLGMLRMKYFKPQAINDTIWKIPQTFTTEMIDKKLESLPCMFKNQNLTFLFDIFQIIATSNAFEYKLRKTVNPQVSDIGEMVE